MDFSLLVRLLYKKILSFSNRGVLLLCLAVLFVVVERDT